jgi:hypothetical protein
MMTDDDVDEQLQSIVELPPMSRRALRTLVDLVWNEATQSTEVTETRHIDAIINKWAKSCAN